MLDHYITFASPDIQQPEIDEVADTMRSGWLGSGPKVAQFERAFAEYVGAKYAIATNSCTAAMHLSLLAADIGMGDEVITTPMTFVSTVNAILHVGAKPVLVDCDRETGLIDLENIIDAVTDYTAAIMPVHLYGRQFKTDIHGITVINDAAHAIEGKHKGNISCFSFYVTKNVTTGAGGMVTTNNSDWADMIRCYANHGMDKDAWKRYSDNGYKHYEVDYPGYEYGMNDIQASIGIHQLARIEANLTRRDEIWHRYNAAFEDLPVGIPPQVEPGTVHARHLYTLMIDLVKSGISRDAFMREMHGRNIGTGVHFIGVHLHPYYRNKFDYDPEDFPNATYISERTVSIPLSSKLTDDEVDYIIENVRSILHG